MTEIRNVAPPRKIYVLFGDERRGPFAPEDLAREGVTPRMLVWYSGCVDWIPAGQARELEDFIGPPEAPGRTGRVFPTRGDSRWADRFVQPHNEEHLRSPYRLGSIAFLVGQICLVLCGVFSLLGFWLDFLAVRDRSFEPFEVLAVIAAVVLGVTASVSLLVGTIGYLTFLYRAWELIQDEYVDTTPGAAVGLLFVPLFNLYWVFVAVRGLAVKANEYAVRNRLRAPRASHMLGLAVCLNYVIYPAWPISFIGLVCNIFIFPSFAKSVYRTVRCFTNENRVEEHEPDVVVRPLAVGGSLAWGLPAHFVAWLALPALVIGVVLTTEFLGRMSRFPGNRRTETRFMVSVLVAILGAVGLGVSFIFARLATLASRKNDEAIEAVAHEEPPHSREDAKPA